VKEIHKGYACPGHQFFLNENYFVNIGVDAHPISQLSDRHRKTEIEPRHPSLEVT
jgi:hypothetical protein